MIFLLYGTDTTEARSKANSLIEKLLLRKPDAMLVRIDSDSFDEESFLGTIESQGLFEAHSIVVLDKVFQNSDAKDIVTGSLKELKKSENVFIILEEKLDKKTVTRIEKQSEKVQEFTSIEKKEKDSFNIFSLTDALGERSRKKLWVYYQKGKMKNISDEEMHGILFWAVKSMLLTQGSNNAKEAGLNPFVFSKNKRYAQNYSEEELHTMSSNLVSLYHDARRGKEALDTAFERFILAI